MPLRATLHRSGFRRGCLPTLNRQPVVTCSTSQASAPLLWVNVITIANTSKLLATQLQAAAQGLGLRGAVTEDHLKRQIAEYLGILY